MVTDQVVAGFVVDEMFAGKDEPKGEQSGVEQTLTEIADDQKGGKIGTEGGPFERD